MTNAKEENLHQFRDKYRGAGKRGVSIEMKDRQTWDFGNNPVCSEDQLCKRTKTKVESSGLFTRAPGSVALSHTGIVSLITLTENLKDIRESSYLYYLSK